MKSFFRTLLFYIKAQFFFRKVDIILSSSVVFNRGDNGENHFFKPFLNFCRINNLTFVVFEEGDLSGSFAKFHHSSHAIQMWPIVLFEMILRKLFSPVFFIQRSLRVFRVMVKRSVLSKHVLNLVGN